MASLASAQSSLSGLLEQISRLSLVGQASRTAVLSPQVVGVQPTSQPPSSNTPELIATLISSDVVIEPNDTNPQEVSAQANFQFKLEATNGDVFLGVGTTPTHPYLNNQKVLSGASFSVYQGNQYFSTGASPINGLSSLTDFGFNGGSTVENGVLLLKRGQSVTIDTAFKFSNLKTNGQYLPASAYSVGLSYINYSTGGTPQRLNLLTNSAWRTDTFILQP